jgi:adenosylcobyric acid synthase
MPARTLMIQGTSSSAGKSIIVAGLCRIFRQEGFKVAPFKAQNMALNSFVTKEGGEIGRAQAVQAEAAGIEPSVHMNPVLLKPEAEASSQVIVLGKVVKRLKASQYYQHTPNLLKVIEDSLNRLRSTYEIVVIEGAGSPAEINLKKREIVNMRVAKMANAPVLLVGDIDRGGVFASLIGTLELLTKRERDLIKGFIINKFRGDLKLLKPGLDLLEKRTGKPVLGVIPYFRDIAIAQEDSVYLDERQPTPASGNLDVAVIRLPHISNYDDFDPLEEQDCTVRYVPRAYELGNPDLIILPGTKSTISDLIYLQNQGLAQAIIDQAQSGIPVIGICGGYQMLGSTIRDPDHAESSIDIMPGLGLLPAETIFDREKATHQAQARLLGGPGWLAGLTDEMVHGYEIHMGRTQGDNTWLEITERSGESTAVRDGIVTSDGRIWGCYLHGLFQNESLRRAWLASLGWRGEGFHAQSKTGYEEGFERLADAVETALDMEYLEDVIAGQDIRRLIQATPPRRPRPEP